MGCVNSRADINDLHPNIFQVMNVDDLGNLITPGRLEVTESDIVLYPRSKQPVKWPLRCLRRYGYDSEIFSFESGRRCSTGPGIFAFKCRRADQLFNLVQTNIQECNNSGEDAISRDLSIPSHSGPTITRLTTIQSEPNYLDPTPLWANSRVNARFSHSQQNGTSRLGSVGSSSGPISPQGTISSPSPPPVMLPPPPPAPQPHPSALYVNEDILSTMATEMEHNNNKSLRRTIQRSYTISSTTSSSGFASETIGMLNNQDIHNHNKPSPLTMTPYMNVDLSNDPSPLSPSHSISVSTPLKEDKYETDNSGHAYVNVNLSQENLLECSNNIRTRVSTLPIVSPSLPPDWDDSSRHCYANLEPKELDNLRTKIAATSASTEKPVVLPVALPAEVTREVNYAVLDLDKNNISVTLTPDNANSLPSPPDSPDKPQKGYATIDFNKTAALSHSANPNVVNDNEGSRKTRHNSTINDLSTPSRQSSSISE
ncbi:fibroblast growth factor receptor substrate 2 [Chelonus insularis]|uniref:fibroblast growth factor receptor substrate 2 n=1 Tax=Chelonus insularis TaxID=460826 RepID=UPI001588AB0E|nr:fibroblast growth factor receptor substrate 2 [Chelonus insularis]XP_034942759.1 fibroblast growth factor receptor substrate 2 [Chelonus insularis]